MRRSKKVINENLDDAQAEIDRLRNRARDIYETAKRADRELTTNESTEFDRITDKRFGSIAVQKERIESLQSELQQAESRENEIMNTRHPSATVYNQTRNGAPDRVLDNNGQGFGTAQRNYAQPAPIARLKAFSDPQCAYDSGQWLKAVIARAIHGTIDDRAEEHCRATGMEIVNVGTESSGVAGGYLTPAPLSTAIIEVRERVGVARQLANVMQMTSDTLSVPKRSGGLSTYVVGEGSAITSSDKSWGLVSVAAKKRACLSYLSQELSEDALISIVDNIVQEQAYALALTEDGELCNGDGSSTYGGIQGLLSSVGSAGVYTCDANENLWTEIDLEDMVATVAKLPDRYFSYEPSWLCSHSFYNAVMARLALGAGGVTLSEIMSGAANVRSFMGYKVYLSSQMPTAPADSTKCCLFGSFDQAILLGDRGGIRLQRSDDIKFVEDLIALKAVSRYDMTIHDAGNSSNAGAYVALSTNAA